MDVVSAWDIEQIRLAAMQYRRESRIAQRRDPLTREDELEAALLAGKCQMDVECLGLLGYSCAWSLYGHRLTIWRRDDAV